jgi:hypothetical protein
MIPTRGQSNAEGYNTDPAVTASPLDPGRAVMHTVGDRVLGNAQTPDFMSTLADRSKLVGFSDLVAVDQGAAAQTIGPTMAHGLLARLASSIGIVSANSAIGSSTFADRVPGTASYANWKVSVESAVRDARLLGKSLIVPAFVSVDGEGNGGDSLAATITNLTNDQANIEADSKALTGQTQAVLRVTDQAPYVRQVQLAQLKMALDLPNKFICTGPRYFLAPTLLGDGVTPDAIHLSGLSQAIAGYHHARAMARKLIDGVNPIPLYIATAVRTGNTVICTFAGDFVGPVVIDIALVSNPGNYGISWIDNGNTATVTGVAITGANQITVTLSAVPTGSNPRIGCARIPDAAFQGPLTGPRSCFRDSSTDTCTINGTTYPLYRWAAHWETPVT